MIATPHYLIDKSKLLPNMEKIAWLRETSGARSLLALKCFAAWSVFDFMADYMDGTTSSSLYEVKLGREKFPGETEQLGGTETIEIRRRRGHPGSHRQLLGVRCHGQLPAGQECRSTAERVQPV